jgi:hypothetical protein
MITIMGIFMVERWKDIEWYEGYYQVSDMGTVRSVGRDVPNGWGGTKRLIGRILTPKKATKAGHVRVSLSMKQDVRVVSVHRLVLETWVGPCPAGCVGVHGPGGPADNSLGNLKWGPRVGVGHSSKGKAVVCDDGREFISAVAAAESTGCCASNLSACCRGELKTAGGREWNYLTSPESMI